MTVPTIGTQDTTPGAEYRHNPAEFKAWQVKDATLRKARKVMNCYCHEGRIPAGAFYKQVFTANLQPVCLACFEIARKAVGS